MLLHRDCSHKNLMMDASSLFPEGFHPIFPDFLPDGLHETFPFTRSVAPVRYYYIDFGISSHFPDDTVNKLVTGQDGLDKEVPELSTTVPYDPFKVDIFILGNVFKKLVYSVCHCTGGLSMLVLCHC